MHFRRKIQLLVALLFTCSAGMAQLSTSFSFSSIAAGNSGSSMGISTPLVVNGQTKCLIVSNGLGVLDIANNGNGHFDGSCKEVPPVTPNLPEFALSLSVYPNPSRGISTLKCKGNFDAGLSCMVRVIAFDGKVVLSQAVPMTVVAAGWTVDLSNYTSGTYMVNVELMHRQYNLKLIRL